MKNGAVKVVVIVVGLVVLYIPFNFLMNRADAALQNGETPEVETAINSAGTETADSESGEILPLPEELTVNDTGLKKNDYTPETYIEPTYDPFSNKYRPYESFEEMIPVADRAANSPPIADLRIRAQNNGMGDQNSGTTQTEFIFDSYASTDAETKSSNLKVRWDFDGDGTLDTFFSKQKNVRHTYSMPGTYRVTLEVLDEGGLTSVSSREVTVVDNTAPYAHFTFSPTSATAGNVFNFKTNHSYDSQYETSALKYRFDWDGDGKWDTPYNSKTVWNHKFETAGDFIVRMEVRDPEGLTDITEALIRVTQNRPPVALISIEVKPVKQVGGASRNRYYFDAGASSDPDGQKMQYRWDFNYTGRNDINFDTYFSYSKQTSGFYEINGQKTVRLQVRDENGEIGEAFMSFEAE